MVRKVKILNGFKAEYYQRYHFLRGFLSRSRVILMSFVVFFLQQSRKIYLQSQLIAPNTFNILYPLNIHIK